jgi:phage baseplate assembly protein W
MADVRTTVPNDYDYVISTSTNFPLSVSGLSKLIQLITYAIKTTPGRDIFEPEYGMGIRDLLPVAAHTITEQRARGDVARGLLKIEEEIKTRQVEEENTAAESLESLTLVDLEFDIENAIWEVTVRVTSSAGESAVLTLTP